jgi:serine/threonine-protein kinase RsbT
VEDETRLPIRTDYDIVAAREKGRSLARQIGLSSTESTLVATAISELARNIVRYAKQGEILIGLVEDGERKGIELEARDEGPGIPDIDRAMQAGYSTSGSLGLGLPGVRRLMDEFEIVSGAGVGTTVRVKKWKQ